MKKTFLAVLAIALSAAACGKGKPIEIEMRLPTPTPTATVLVTITPTSGPSPSPTPKVELHYLIEDMKGTVLILSGDSTVPESAAIGETVETGDELMTKSGSEATLALNDDTMVHLSSDTQIKITDLTPNTAHGFKSKIQLLLGNVLSEVEKLSESRSSFEVEAGGVVCAVRGTAFEVQKDGDNINTSTFHGTVEMKKGGHTQKVKENQHSTFSLKRSGFLQQRRLSPTEKKHYQIWYKKRLVVQKKRMERRPTRKDIPSTQGHAGSTKLKGLKKGQAKDRAHQVNSIKQPRVQNKKQKVQPHTKPKPQTLHHLEKQKIAPTLHSKPVTRAKPAMRPKPAVISKHAQIKPQARKTPQPKKSVKKKPL